MKVVLTKITLFLKKGQAKLLVFSLLYVLAFLFILLSCCLFPLAAVCILLVLNTGFKNVLLFAYKHKSWNTDDMFSGFHNFRHICFGMLWAYFKALVWAIIPGGIVMTVYKLYQYRFVPYILSSKKEVRATDALSISLKATDGFKGYLFAVDLILLGCFVIVEGILLALSFIDPMRNVFFAIMIVFGAAFLLLLPFVRGTSDAIIFAEATGERITLQRKSVTCPSCKNRMSGNAHYCSRCGEKMVV